MCLMITTIDNRAEYPCSLFPVLRGVPHTYLSYTYVEPSSVISSDVDTLGAFCSRSLISLGSSTSLLMGRAAGAD